MSVERIVEHSRRTYRCEWCGHAIPQGDRYRRVTFFPAELDHMCGDVPLHSPYHLACPPMGASVAGQEPDEHGY